MIGKCAVESTLNCVLFGTPGKGRSSLVAQIQIECIVRIYVLHPPASENNGVVETCRNGPNGSKEETRGQRLVRG